MSDFTLIRHQKTSPKEREKGELSSEFAGYVPLASLNPYPIIVYFGHLWANLTTFFTILETLLKIENATQ